MQKSIEFHLTIKFHGCLHFDTEIMKNDTLGTFITSSIKKVRSFALECKVGIMKAKQDKRL